jgi:predicted nuclease of restriction endonuclease-like (RecB) superfamily
MFATLSQTLTWSHLIELATIDNQAQRLFYQKMCIEQRWSTRQLIRQQDAMLYERTLIAAKPEDEQVALIDNLEPGELTPEMVLKSSYVVDFLGLHGYYSEKNLENAILQQLENFILELGHGFAFLERQKRISVDAVDYYIDMLFYHRGLNRLVAIDLKLGKFKPEYKGQMELYLKYLDRYERKPHEESPIGLLLCSEGNTEQVELMMLDEDNIKVAQYLTELPDKQWFIDKLNRSILIAQENQANKTK